MPKLHAHIREAHGQPTLQKHRLNTLKQHLCQLCGRVFAYPHHLRNHHLLAHAKENISSECDICGKEFPSSKHLQKHKRFVHTDKRQYVCRTCGKAFKSPTNLHQHQQQHKPRKWVCHCGDAFTYRHGLRNHQVRCLAGLPCRRTHTKDRPQKDELGNIIPPRPVGPDYPESNGSSLVVENGNPVTDKPLTEHPIEAPGPVSQLVPTYMPPTTQSNIPVMTPFIPPSVFPPGFLPHPGFGHG